VIERIENHWRSIKAGIKSDRPMDVGKALTKAFLTVVAILAILPQVDSEGDWQFRVFALLFSPSNEIGDTFAGVAGVLAFLWIIVTVWLQSEELAEQRKELKRQADEFNAMNTNLRSQQFETTFFELLRTHSEIVGGLDVVKKDSKDKLAEGRDCFVFYYRELNKVYREKLKKHDEGIALFYAYKDFWNRRGNDLGHYFRFLYNCFRVLEDEKEFSKPRHAKLLRAQLSDAELLLLFYNCVSLKGEPFQTYASKFELFDNLPTLKLLNHSHIGLLGSEAFGDNPKLTPNENRKLERAHILALETSVRSRP
jgi:hypothetical protein